MSEKQKHTQKQTRADLIAAGHLVDVRAMHPEAIERARFPLAVAVSAVLYHAAVWPADPHARALLEREGETPDARACRVLTAYRRTAQTQGQRIHSPIFAFAVPVMVAPGDFRELKLIGRLDASDTSDPDPVVTLALAPTLPEELDEPQDFDA